MPLRALLEPEIRKRSSQEWFASLRKAGIPGGPVLTIEELAHDPHVRATRMLVTIEGYKQPIQVLGNPIRFGAAAAPPLVRAPALGEHSLDVLRDAGLSSGEIRALEAAGAVKRTGPEQT